MTPEMAAKFDAWTEENTEDTGLNFDWLSRSTICKQSSLKQ
jgi:hypothetical protein